MTDLIGQYLGRYHILEQIGQGGMATVYRAFDTRLDRDVAVKMIRKSAFSAEMLERVLARFEREAKALARLSHPNILKVHDFGEHDGSPYLVMEFMPGGTLKQRLGQPVAWGETLRLLLPVARGLAYAHGRGIVHRDVKPANILITESGEPMLTDFGIAKLLENEEGQTLTGSGVGIGTPEYMAPEQGMGVKGVDGRVDIYSLGIVLYEMITGRKPYTADTPMAVVLKQMTDPLPRPRESVPDLPESIERLLIRSLAKKPEDRFASMDDMAAAMQSCLDELPTAEFTGLGKTLPTQDDMVTVEETPTSDSTFDQVAGSLPVLPVVPPQRSNRPIRVWAGLGIVLLALAGLAGWWFFSSSGGDDLALPLPSPTDPAVAASSQAPVSEITVWVAYNPTSAEMNALQQNIERVAGQLGYPIQVVHVPFDQIFNRYRTEVTAGAGPDLLLAPNDNLGELARVGVFAPIDTPLIGYDGLAIQGMKVDGQLYGIPESIKGLSLYYNRDVIVSPPTTTDELQRMMSAGARIGISLGCYHHYWAYGAFGGRIFDENMQVVADQGGVADAMAYLSGLKRVSDANGWSTSPEQGLQDFLDGDLDAVIAGNWSLGEMRAAYGDSLGVTALPIGPGGAGSPLIGMDGFYLNPNSPSPQQAIQVAMYLTNQASQEVMLEQAGHIPVNLDSIDNQPLLLDLFTSLQNGLVRPQSEELNLYWTYFCDTEAVLSGTVAAQTWVQQATDNANR